MKKILITLFIFISLSSFSQENKSLTFSVYSAFNFSKGFEIRPEFEDWYMAFQFENFNKDIGDKKDILHFNWGGSIGVIKRYRDFNFLTGIRLGFIKIPDDTLKPSYGAELEVDYNLNENAYIGIRGTYDQYMNSTIHQINSIKYSRFFLKFGIRF